MLVLTRKLQEKIHIGDNITITIVRIQGSTVRVGIEAPGETRIVRGEVLARDQAELAAAEVETPACDTSVKSHVLLQRKTPLGRIAGRKPRLRLALADGRPDCQGPVRAPCAVANLAPALTC